MSIKISAYKPKYSNKNSSYVPGVVPYEVDFFDEMLAIKNGKYKEIVDVVRSIQDKKERDAYKIQHLPALTISALVKDYRSVDNVVNHSGLLNIDIDPKGNDNLKSVSDYEALRDTIAGMPAVICSFLSVSGMGLTFVVKINPDQHEDCFRSIEYELQKNMAIKIDSGTGDVVRLRFVSYDPDMYLINPDDFQIAPTYKPTKEYLESKRKRVKSSSTSSSTSSQVEEDVAFVVKQIEQHQIDITSGYTEWRNLGFSLADGLSEKGRDYFHRLSQFHDSYDPDDCDQQYDRCLNAKRNGMENSISIKTFFGIAQDHAIDIAPRKKLQSSPIPVEVVPEISEDMQTFLLSKIKAGVKLSAADIDFIGQKYKRNVDDKLKKELDDFYQKNEELFGFDKKPAIEKVELYFKKKYDFRRNVITQKPEMRKKTETEFYKVNHDSLFRDCSHSGLTYPLDKIKSLLRSDFVKDYDPFKEYFESLPAWDGVTDYIDQLASHVKTAGQEFWTQQFKKALVRSIPCAISGMENRIIMVLIGEKQNTGKSTFIKFLNPFGNKYYTDEKLRDDKDSIIRLSENFIYNLEELSGARTFEINSLKAIISKKSVKQRKAYAEDEEEQPRRCNFWASTNTAQFLTDTENTRWLCFEVDAINHDYYNMETGVQKIDIHKVWAQAYSLYKMGFNFQLTREESERRDVVNKQYETTSADYEFLMEELGHPKDYPTIPAQALTASRIGEHLQSMLSASGIKVNMKEIPHALKQLGFTERRIATPDGKRPRVYDVVFKRQSTPINYNTENPQF
jgi:hypothetical protein